MTMSFTAPDAFIQPLAGSASATAAQDMSWPSRNGAFNSCFIQIDHHRPLRVQDASQKPLRPDEEAGYLTNAENKTKKQKRPTKAVPKCGAIFGTHKWAHLTTFTQIRY